MWQMQARVMSNMKRCAACPSNERLLVNLVFDVLDSGPLIVMLYMSIVTAIRVTFPSSRKPKREIWIHVVETRSPIAEHLPSQ